MDSDTIDFFAKENRKRAAEIDALIKAMHVQDKEIQTLKREVAALKAMPGEGDAQAQRDNAAPDDKLRRDALARMGKPGLAL